MRRKYNELPLCQQLRPDTTVNIYLLEPKQIEDLYEEYKGFDFFLLDIVSLLNNVVSEQSLSYSIQSLFIKFP